MKILVLLFVLGVQQLATSPVIESIQIRGNRRTLSSTIRSQIQSNPGNVFDGGLARRDIDAIRTVPGIGDVRLEEAAGTNGGVVLVFYVSERPQVRVVRFVGMSALQESEIVKVLGDQNLTLRQGTVYDETTARRAADVLKSLLMERGRQDADVSVETQAIPPNSVEVTFRIRE